MGARRSGRTMERCTMMTWCYRFKYQAEDAGRGRQGEEIGRYGRKGSSACKVNWVRHRVHAIKLRKRSALPPAEAPPRRKRQEAHPLLRRVNVSMSNFLGGSESLNKRRYLTERTVYRRLPAHAAGLIWRVFSRTPLVAYN